MNSFDFGAIFQASSGYELSRNVFVVSVYAFYRNPYWRMCSGMTPENRDFHEISGKTLAAELKVNFGGPTGGSAPGKVLRPQDVFLHDS